MSDAIEFDSSKFFVGPLCRNVHHFNGQSGSLRYASTRSCVECGKEYIKRNSEVIKDKNRQRRIEKQAEISEQRKRRYQENKEIILERSKKRYEKNREEILARSREKVKEKRAEKLKNRVFVDVLIEFDPHKYYLGEVCRNGHRLINTQQNLRFINDEECVACRKNRYK